MHTEAILWMLSWPILIVISYQAIKQVLKKYESKTESEEDSE